VLVRGAVHHVDTEAERASIMNAGVQPWIEGEPEHIIQINSAQTWGHRIRRA
jgi:plasmid stability protein